MRIVKNTPQTPTSNTAFAAIQSGFTTPQSSRRFSFPDKDDFPYETEPTELELNPGGLAFEIIYLASLGYTWRQIWNWFYQAFEGDMSGCPEEFPRVVTWKFSSKEVMAVATIHLWDLNEKLDWIEENNIDGLSFQGLNDSILQGFGVEYVEDRKRILNLKQKFKTVSEL